MGGVRARLRAAGAGELDGHSLLRWAGDTAAQEGVRGFFRGWSASLLRQGPQTVIILTVMERIRAWCGTEPM